MSTNDAAELALDFAMACIREGTQPWRAAEADIEWLRDQFKDDFTDQIPDYGGYKVWEPRVRRLFVLAGSLAKFFAEARQQDVNTAAESVTRKDLKAACAIVKYCVCPTRMSLEREAKVDDALRREICKKAGFLNSLGVKESVGDMLSELTRVREVFSAKS